MVSTLMSRVYDYRAQFGKSPDRLTITRDEFDLILDEMRGIGVGITNEDSHARLPDGSAGLFMGIPLDVVDAK
jgi:hypothetical protein